MEGKRGTGTWEKGTGEVQEKGGQGLGFPRSANMARGTWRKEEQMQ